MAAITREQLEDAFDARFRDTRDNWVGLCPFHLESTPSFSVHKDDLVGHCFGCGIAGRLDILVSRYAGCSPANARQKLGLTSLPWIEREYRPEPEPKYPQSWIRAWKRISNHPYLVRRGFDRKIVEHFQMRWDPDTKRVVWPLQTREQRVVGAVGRATDGRDPKYLFYWNCDKGESLWTAPSFWQDQDFESVIVVEGILDCMWMWQQGLRNTVSPIGAHLTKAQLAQLKEFNTVTLALDNDKEGRIGALKAEEALKSSCNVRYAMYPEHAKDANDLTGEEIRKVFSNPVTPLEMKLCTH